MKRYLNLTDINDFEENDGGTFKEKFYSISDKLGAKKLGYSMVILEPGFKACPFHNHHINEEMFLILEGEGTLRCGDQHYKVKTQDIIACPPGDRDVAHQIINTGSTALKYLCLSTNEPMEICEYPESNKVQSSVGEQGNRTFRHMSYLLIRQAFN